MFIYRQDVDWVSNRFILNDNEYNIKGFSILDNAYFLEGATDNKMITQFPPAATPND